MQILLLLFFDILLFSYDIGNKVCDIAQEMWQKETEISGEDAGSINREARNRAEDPKVVHEGNWIAGGENGCQYAMGKGESCPDWEY